MCAETWVKEATCALKQAGISTARLDCLVLLEDCLNKNRAQILAYPDLEMTSEQLYWLDSRIKRRATHEPLAYIRGRAEFYGRTFFVDKHVLIPRPETEAMVEALKKLPDAQTMRVADIGSGSGCIGITAALELPKTEVALYDIDPATLAVAKKNATSLNAKVGLHRSDLLQDLVTSYDVLLANLPYVPDGKLENIDASFEPALALFAGSDGLDLYRKFWNQVKKLQRQPRYILTESRPQQQTMQQNFAHAAGYRLSATDSFIQTFEPI
jgi:release factor glutamine methyltransferase